MSAAGDTLEEMRQVRGGRVLYIEDSADLRLAVRLALEVAGWEVTTASSAAEGFDAVIDCDPDVVLLDLGLPDMPGVDVLDRIKLDPATAWVPVVVLSGRSQPDEVAALLRAGAQDYLVKPFESDELEARLVAARRVAVEHRRMRALEQQLQHLVDHDSLTGLLNRRGFEAVLDQHVARVARYDSPWSLLLLDLDAFKAINDTRGHPAGDAVLASVASVLRGALRASDVVARIGGDEFAVLLPHASASQAAIVADKILHAVRNTAVLGSNGTLSVTVSIGVAPFDRPDPRAADALAVADSSMYRAKRAGGDQWATFTELAGRP